MFSVEPVVLPPCFLLHGIHGCNRHPAFPAPSVFERDKNGGQTSGACRRENAASCPLGCLKIESEICDASGSVDAMDTFLARAASVASPCPVAPVARVNSGARSFLLTHISNWL